MKWKKLGSIFRPSDYALPFGCFAYAKGPQVVTMDGFRRVYFSSCSQDSSGKYLSNVCYADFSLGFGEIRNVNRHEVIALGGLGAFDEHGIFPVHIFRENPNKLWAYTTGWSRRVSVSADAAIGLNVSSDSGWTFQRLGTGPIMSASLNEPFLVADPFVLKAGKEYHMWYIFGLRWIFVEKGQQAERVYKIAHATSRDGVNWKRESLPIIKDNIGSDECQALPSVLKVNGVYHMVFCYRDAFGFRTERGKGYRLGYAYSLDLVHWVRNDSLLNLPLTGEGWDGEMMCYPHLFDLGGQTALLYNGNHFGRDGFGLAILQSDINEHIK